MPPPEPRCWQGWGSEVLGRGAGVLPAWSRQAPLGSRPRHSGPAPLGTRRPPPPVCVLRGPCSGHSSGVGTWTPTRGPRLNPPQVLKADKGPIRYRHCAVAAFFKREPHRFNSKERGGEWGALAAAARRTGASRIARPLSPSSPAGGVPPSREGLPQRDVFFPGCLREKSHRPPRRRAGRWLPQGALNQTQFAGTQRVRSKLDRSAATCRLVLDREGRKPGPRCELLVPGSSTRSCQDLAVPGRLKEAGPGGCCPLGMCRAWVRELRGLPASGSFCPVATRLERPPGPDGTLFLFSLCAQHPSPGRLRSRRSSGNTFD